MGDGLCRAGVYYDPGCGLFLWGDGEEEKHPFHSDAVFCHYLYSIGGTWGTLATGLFAAVAVNSGGADGLLLGNMKLFVAQLIYLAVCITYALVVTWILYKIVDALVGMKVDKQSKLIGLDLTQHNESAYTVLE